MEGRGDHDPILARLRAAAVRIGHSTTPFRQRQIAPWAVLGIVSLGILTVLPFVWARSALVTERLLVLGALVFLVAAPGLWIGLSKRAMAISAVLVLGIYGITAFTLKSAAVQDGPLQDLYIVSVIVAFVVFALAGFELVFVLEEMVYDAHRLFLGRRHRHAILPLLLVTALSLAIPFWMRHGGPELPATAVAAVVTTLLLAVWWFVRSLNNIDRRHTILRELHLFVAGILMAALLLDGIQYLQAASELIPSLVAYLVLLGTWVYVSYTTLQRAHLLVQGRNAAPWAAILLAASYAIVAHAQAQYFRSEHLAVEDLVAQRISYMVIGVWVGIAFFVVRSVWRAFRMMGVSRSMTPRGRAMADQAARVAEGVLFTERIVGEATKDIYRALDRVLPGTPKAEPAPPRKAGWELAADAPVQALGEDAEE
ncbi:MAG: hypothetical protein QOD77_1477 [Thermoplasmata archaeon]|nr:hypothetical protein [Thermoplasmata archaeon]